MPQQQPVAGRERMSFKESPIFARMLTTRIEDVDDQNHVLRTVYFFLKSLKTTFLNIQIFTKEVLPSIHGTTTVFFVHGSLSLAVHTFPAPDVSLGGRI